MKHAGDLTQEFHFYNQDFADGINFRERHGEHMDVMSKQRAAFRGAGVSGGKACGTLKFFRKPTVRPAPSSRPVHPSAELTRLRQAMETAREQIAELHRRALADIGKNEAEIFEIHAMLLEDEDFTETLTNEIVAGKCAEDAVEGAVQVWSRMLRELNDPYLSARAADIRDIADRLLRILAGETQESAAAYTGSFILVAEDLTPSETVLLDKSRILGFVTFGGSSNSHTSILARAMGIPALVGVGKIDEELDSQLALLDADAGTLTVCPGEAELEAFRQAQERQDAQARDQEKSRRALIGRPSVTLGGHRMLIYANIGEGAEVAHALADGADGIGLLRSEFLYLSLNDYPSEERLFEAYRQIVSDMQGKKVVIRTLDIGADKQIPYFDLPHEENPALGFRAVRICLAREPLFKTQLRAILRASAFGNAAVMIPMIVSAEEVRRCRRLFDECKAELICEGVDFDARMEFGIMVETPAAAVMSDEISAEVDFFSVGTNDLAQYTLAADRQNPMLAELCERNTEPVLRLIERAAKAIHGRGGWIGICGELAADLRLTQRFADMGIDELSVSVPNLLAVREQVLRCK